MLASIISKVGEFVFHSSTDGMKDKNKIPHLTCVHYVNGQYSLSDHVVALSKIVI
jgi:hypothetical protein